MFSVLDRGRTRARQEFGNVERPLSGLSSVNTKTIRRGAVSDDTVVANDRSEFDGISDKQRMVCANRPGRKSEGLFDVAESP